MTASMQTLSFKYVLSEGSYTAASITAVDLCGQRSEPFDLELMVNNTNRGLTTSTMCDLKKSTVDGLAGALALVIAIIIALFIVIITIIVICKCKNINHKGRRATISQNYIL